MSAPAVLIRLELEAPPRVIFDCMSESESLRMDDHLEAHPEQLSLVARAYELVEREPSA